LNKESKKMSLEDAFKIGKEEAQENKEEEK